MMKTRKRNSLSCNELYDFGTGDMAKHFMRLPRCLKFAFEQWQQLT